MNDRYYDNRIGSLAAHMRPQESSEDSLEVIISDLYDRIADLERNIGVFDFALGSLLDQHTVWQMPKRFLNH